MHPTTLVIFGASGDLANRKLLPALYNLAHEGALPVRFNIVGDLARGVHGRGVPRRARRPRSTGSAAASSTTRCSRRCSPMPATSPACSTTRRPTRSCAASWTATTRRRPSRSTASSTCRPRPTFFPVIVGALGEAGLATHEGRAGALRDREAVRHLAPGGARPERARAVGVRGGSDLPDRSLPREGDGPEPAGVPLRQRHVRAAVEPQLRRQRADHRVRGPRDRHARRLLRRRRRAARPRPEPHAAAAVPAVHGAADRLHRGPRAQREGQGPARDPHAAAA